MIRRLPGKNFLITYLKASKLQKYWRDLQEQSKLLKLRQILEYTVYAVFDSKQYTFPFMLSKIFSSSLGTRLKICGLISLTVSDINNINEAEAQRKGEAE
jgi:hypothetical protein